jgi:tetratricopeptide (TPR) repeat protein
MDTNHKDIENYIDGALTPPEMETFRERLQTDPILAEAYESELNARRLITEAGRLDLKDTLEQFDAEMKQHSNATVKTTGKVIPLYMKRVLPIAAMLIIFLGIFTVMQNDSMTTSEAYTTYFSTYEAPSVIRDATRNELVNWETAAQLYSEKKYREAIPYFTKAQGEVPQYLSEYYKGMCNLNLDGAYYQRAVTALDIVLETDNDYREQAQWYKALTLLKMNQIKEATTLFETIAAQKTYNYKEAEEILKLELKPKH